MHERVENVTGLPHLHDDLADIAFHYKSFKPFTRNNDGEEIQNARQGCHIQSY